MGYYVSYSYYGLVALLVLVVALYILFTGSGEVRVPGLVPRTRR
jgi:hypothetical protein